MAAPTDPAVLLGILERPEVLKQLAGVDPLMPARIIFRQSQGQHRKST
jgi:hypothetical protein